MERQPVVVAVLGQQPEVLNRFRRVRREELDLDGPLSVSMTACMPPELLAPAGTFGFPGELQPASHSATRNESTSDRASRAKTPGVVDAGTDSGCLATGSRIAQGAAFYFFGTNPFFSKSLPTAVARPLTNVPMFFGSVVSLSPAQTSLPLAMS